MSLPISSQVPADDVIDLCGQSNPRDSKLGTLDFKLFWLNDCFFFGWIFVVVLI
jgi:hypothetical protein